MTDDTVQVRELALSLRDVARRVERLSEVQAGLRPLPPTELEVVRSIAEQPGVRAAELAGELALQPSNVSTAVRALVGRGLVRREPDGADARARRLYPTDRALADRDALADAWTVLVGGLLARLAAPDAELLRRAAPALGALADELARQRRS